MAAGAADQAEAWVFLSGGAGVLLSGVLCIGTRGSVLMGLLGIWLLVSPATGWAAAQWNLLLAGIAAVTLGVLVGAVGSTRDPAAEVGVRMKRDTV